MIDHTVEEVESAEAFFKRNNYFPYYSYISESDEPSRIMFYLLPQALNPDLPGFVYRVSNDVTRRHVIGVCESNPVILQMPLAYAEYMEFVVYGIYSRDRVVKSEADTLRITPGYVRNEYIDAKIKLLKKDIKLNSLNHDIYSLDDDDISQFESAILFLENERR